MSLINPDMKIMKLTTILTILAFCLVSASACSDFGSSIKPRENILSGNENSGKTVDRASEKDREITL